MNLSSKFIHIGAQTKLVRYSSYNWHQQLQSKYTIFNIRQDCDKCTWEQQSQSHHLEWHATQSVVNKHITGYYYYYYY